MAPPPDSDDSDDETPKRSTRQAYRSFNGTTEQERRMLIRALRGELSSREPKFVKQTLNKNATNRILKSLQDEDISIEKVTSQAARAFSLTWVKQIAPGKLQYKPQFFSKYARIIETLRITTTKTKQPLVKVMPTKPPAAPTQVPTPTPPITQDLPSDHDN
jgi:uncharacterized caspase-like protein